MMINVMTTTTYLEVDVQLHGVVPHFENLVAGRHQVSAISGHHEAVARLSVNVVHLNNNHRSMWVNVVHLNNNHRSMITHHAG
jgi:hypothetical protein